MGTTTIFEGAFWLDRPLRPEHAEYLRRFACTRRMQRDPVLVAALPDPARIAAGLPLGEEGAYFVGGGRFVHEYARDPTVVDSSQEPAGQPGLWCQWVPTKDGCGIEWDGGEKFYDWTEWLR
jgi:hypothetical protein